MVGCVRPVGDEVWIYYSGWSRGMTLPYRVSCGRAVSRDGGLIFTRRFAGPVVDRTPLEPHMTMSPYVPAESGRWRMWYGYGTKWVEVGGQPEPIYVIKYAESPDGLSWHQPNRLCIAPLHPLEANTRPSMLAGDVVRLPPQPGFPRRLRRLPHRPRGVAGRARLAAAGRPRRPRPAGEGWNSAMMACPCVVNAGGQRMMFHNGNGFDRSGFSRWVAP